MLVSLAALYDRMSDLLFVYHHDIVCCISHCASVAVLICVLIDILVLFHLGITNPL